jgi:FSR family fosmidomycin resistance protein-like MFS transporter
MASESHVITFETTEQRGRMNAGMMALVLYSFAHFFIDMYSSAAGAFQPLLVEKLGMTLTKAGLLGAMMVFSGSFVQPAYGYLSDRFHSRMFSALAPAVAGIFIASLGLAWNFQIAAMLIFLGGAGIASFHPQASARATAGMSTNRGRWMAVFISSGSLGLALGPVYFTSIIQWAGLRRSYIGAIPGVLVTIFLLIYMRQPEHIDTKRRRDFDLGALRVVWKPLTVLCVLVVLRSAVQMVFGQFLPLYLHRERGFSLQEASAALSLFQAAGALGGFAGGHSLDRFGGRRVIMWSMIVSVPFLALFFFGHGLLAMIGLGLGGLTLLFTIPVNIAMAQELAPTQAGTVSALMMGFAWGLAGLMFVPLIGFTADSFTMQTAMSGLMVLPVIGFALSFKLPKHVSTRHA